MSMEVFGSIGQTDLTPGQQQLLPRNCERRERIDIRSVKVDLIVREHMQMNAFRCIHRVQQSGVGFAKVEAPTEAELLKGLQRSSGIEIGPARLPNPEISRSSTSRSKCAATHARTTVCWFGLFILFE